MDEAVSLKLNKIVSPESFYKEIDKLVKVHKIEYIDAIVHYCEINNIEIETAAALLKSNAKIKSAIQSEGEALNYLPKTARLPI